jgi:hypothetical protein
MIIEILPGAKEDLAAGYNFYERRSPGLGSYFYDSLFSDIDSLKNYAGTHPFVYGSYRAISRRFLSRSIMK